MHCHGTLFSMIFAPYFGSKHASTSRPAPQPPRDPTRFATREAEDRFHTRLSTRSVVCERPIVIVDFSDLPLYSWLWDRHWSYFFHYQGQAIITLVLEFYRELFNLMLG